MTVYTAQTYNDPTGLNSDPGDPVTSELAKAALFNFRAMAQGSSGADTVQVAWHFLEYFEQASATTGTISLTTDLTNFRAVRLLGNCAVGGGGGAPIVDVRGTNGVTSPLLVQFSPGATLNFWLDVENFDNGDDSLNQKVSRYVYTGGSGVVFTSSTVVCDEIFIDPDGSTIVAGNFALYGIKRTQT